MENIAPRKRGRPRKAPDTQDGQVVHVRIGSSTLAQLNAEWAQRNAPSRAEIIREILDAWAINQVDESP